MRSALILLIFSFTAAKNSALEFTAANNLFAHSIYQYLSNNRDGNFLVSPFSAETILAFVHSGSRGDTAEELRKALHLPEDKNEIEAEIKSLLPKFKGNDSYILQTANKLYLNKNFVVHNDFEVVANVIYGADIERIDFVPDAVQAAKTINNWVEDQTENKIKDLVDYSDFDNVTKAILVNALYFKAEWLSPFARYDTEEEKFYKDSNDVVKVDTLHHYMKHFNYHECPDLEAQFVELPFQGDDASMVIVLPKTIDGLSSIENQLDKVFEREHKLTPQLLDVTLPKFKIETTTDFKEILEWMGVTRIFKESLADLSGIAGDPGDLFIKKVAQKAFIDVDENGIEAAAATNVFAGVRKLGFDEPPTFFFADHPFLFYIKVKNIVIFIGRLTDPS